MSTQTFTGDGGELVVEYDPIEVTGMVTKPDTGWRFTDAAGHRHAYWDERDPYPTLTLERDEPQWCADCQDDHADEYYICKQCSERITPGTHSFQETSRIQGLARYTLTTTREVSKDEAEAWLNEQRGG